MFHFFVSCIGRILIKKKYKILLGNYKNFKCAQLIQYWMFLFDFLFALIKSFYDSTISVNVFFKKKTDYSTVIT